MSIEPTKAHRHGFSGQIENSAHRQLTTSSTSQPATSSAYRGQTIVKQKALVRVAGQVTADTLGVKAKNVKVSIHDDGTRLGLALETPLSEADMTRCTSTPDMTVFSLCESARKKITERAAHITGHCIGDVDVIIDGIEKDRTNNRRVE